LIGCVRRRDGHDHRHDPAARLGPEGQASPRQSAAWPLDDIDVRRRPAPRRDNLAAHKVDGVRQCLEDAGMGLLYLPPYSPDFNPIEQAFAKALPSEVEGIKALLRRAAPRSFDAILDALKPILERFRPAECANYLRHSGYVKA
jgi:transposase